MNFGLIVKQQNEIGCTKTTDIPGPESGGRSKEDLFFFMLCSGILNVGDEYDLTSIFID